MAGLLVPINVPGMSRRWKQPSYPEARWAEDVYRLGNLTLPSPSANRRVGNAEYSVKLGEYADSGYALTREIVDTAPEHWSPEILSHRQRRMADRAVHLWRSDFA
jgi:hypothetical protein